MEAPFKSISLSTFVHATESEKKMKNALKSLLPEDVEIEKSMAEGHHGDPITILRARIDRRPFIKEFWHQVLSRLPKKEREKLAGSALDRIGDDCRLYLRFDKQLAIQDKLVLTSSGDVLHVRINISAYPAKRKIAARKMEKFISSELTCKKT